jgi:hypothetical protein
VLGPSLAEILDPASSSRSVARPTTECMEHAADNVIETISGPACAVLGAVGFFTGPILMAGSTSRYLVLFADLGALALGCYAFYAAWRGRTRWDTVVFGVVLALISLTLWVMASRSGVIPGGGT